MKQLLSLSTILILINILQVQSSFLQKGDLTNAYTIQQINTQSNRNASISEEYNFDIAQYNQKGDWANIQYNNGSKQIMITFNKINGEQISQMFLQSEKEIFGQLGVSLIGIERQNEVFVTLTQFNEDTQKTEIIGGIIDINGDRKKQNWDTIFKSTMYNFQTPFIQKNNDYIYIGAFAYIDDNNQGHFAFNYIDIKQQKKNIYEINEEVIIVQYQQNEDQQMLYISPQAGIKCLQQEQNVSYCFFMKYQDDQELDGESQIMFLKVENGEIQQIQSLNGQKAVSPKFDVSIVPNTNLVTISFEKLENLLNISTLNIDSNEIVCQKQQDIIQSQFTISQPQGFAFMPIFQEQQQQQRNNDLFYPEIVLKKKWMNPKIISVDNTKGFISYINTSIDLETFNYFLTQYNPQTCEILSDSIPQTIQPLTNNVQDYQQMMILEDKHTNQYKISHFGTDESFNIQTTHINLFSMQNCDEKDIDLNICKSCQPGFILTEKGECHTPHCAMNCSLYGLQCDNVSQMCVECTNSLQCKQSNKGQVCVQNICQTSCYQASDCYSLNQICDLTLNQCQDEIILPENVIEYDNNQENEEIDVIESNDDEYIDLKFDIDNNNNQQVENFQFEFQSLKVNGNNCFPQSYSQGKTFINIKINKSQIIRNQNNQFRAFGILYFINGNRRNLDQDQSFVSFNKQLFIVDSLKQYLQQQINDQNNNNNDQNNNTNDQNNDNNQNNDNSENNNDNQQQSEGENSNQQDTDSQQQNNDNNEDENISQEQQNQNTNQQQQDDNSTDNNNDNSNYKNQEESQQQQKIIKSSEIKSKSDLIYVYILGPLMIISNIIIGIIGYKCGITKQRSISKQSNTNRIYPVIPSENIINTEQSLNEKI